MGRQKGFNTDKLKEENRMKREIIELEKFLIRDRQFFSNYTNEELLALIKKTGDASNMRLCFFIKSLETFTWQELVFLWGMEECDRLYTDKVRRGIFQKSIREAYDGLFWLLRNKPILPSKRSPEELEKFKEALLLKRRNRIKI